MLFSFVSTVFNQEKYIAAHLESIKYQIITYGREYEFELVLCDDCSTDKTLDYANRWLNNNRNLFKFVKILASKTNEGIVRNYIKGLTSFEGDFFHSLGGDDLYGCSNLFDCVELLKEFDIVQASILEFEDDKIKTDLKSESFISFQSLKIKELRQNSRRGNFIFLAPGFFFKKQLITKELISFLLKFKMFEDRPLYYNLLKNEDIKIYYYQTPVVLYRISASSISQNKDHYNNKDLIKDNETFFLELLNEANTPLQKMYIRYCLTRLNSSKLGLLYRLNPFSLFDTGNKIIKNIEHRSRSNAYSRNLTNLIRKNEAHILFCSQDKFSSAIKTSRQTANDYS